MEAALLKNLSHPGIPVIYDIDEDDDYIYLTEEYIRGESLETFVLRQENISQELLLNLSIQLCDILDYLHHLSPYPVLHQDLKPEHIILCGNQVKLIDFGIASFFTGSGKHFQIYGTEGYAAPEAVSGLPTTPSADIYSLGKVLRFLADAAGTPASFRLSRIISRATGDDPSKRFASAAELKSALISVQKNACRYSSHLIRNIAVIGSRTGAGATHFSIALVSVLNRKGISSLYVPGDHTDTTAAISRTNRHMKEQDGIFYYEFFKGIPDYGTGIDFPIAEDCCLVKDCGAAPTEADILMTSDLNFFIASGSDWDMEQTLLAWRHLSFREQTIFICNYHNRKAAVTYAKLLGKKVYCYPYDDDPYRVTAEKERLISAILQKKGGRHRYLALRERE